jgi:halimadienyl-diphosphate synthase
MHTIQSLLKEMGDGHMANTAYDTAWLARLNDFDREMSNHALEWISENQLEDGGWGAKNVSYYHDRVISTLSAMIALNYRGRRAYDKNQIEKGLSALEQIAAGATRGLAADPNGATVGFEMIVPTLVAEAERMGIIKQQGDRILGRLSKMRKLKMAKLSGLKINRHLTAVLSSEMAGTDSTHLLDMENLQEPNGSVGYSPASTAYFALQIKPGDQRAINYLKSIVREDGGAPFVAPFDIFERCWILWNFSLLEDYERETMELIQPHLDFLKQRWVAGKGVSFVSNCALLDSDDTSVTHRILTRFECPPDLDALLSYEEKDHFRCYHYEVNPSVGANLHILGALKLAGYDKGHPAIQKILKFLLRTRYENTYWFDKWHASPYYITSHVIIECQGLDNDLCQVAIDWILKTQNSNGSWGFYGVCTAEETAFCLQALKIWRKNGGKLPGECIERASTWLNQHCEPPYPWMWIGKTLYYPELLIQSIILTALVL